MSELIAQKEISKPLEINFVDILKIIWGSTFLLSHLSIIVNSKRYNKENKLLRKPIFDCLTCAPQDTNQITLKLIKNYPNTVKQIKYFKDVNLSFETIKSIVLDNLLILYLENCINSDDYYRIFEDEKDLTKFNDFPAINIDKSLLVDKKYTIVEKWHKTKDGRYIESDKKVNQRNNEDWELTPSSI